MKNTKINTINKKVLTFIFNALYGFFRDVRRKEKYILKITIDKESRFDMYF